MTDEITEHEENVDPTTGEILPTIPEDVDVEALANFGRWIRSSQRALMHLNKGVKGCMCENCNLLREADKLVGLINRRQEKYKKQLSEQLAMAEECVRTTGQENIHHPGIGRFRFRQMPATLDRSKYFGLSDRLKLELHTNRQGYFNHITKCVPDWKRITDETKAGTFGEDLPNPDLNNLFSMIPGEKKFEFKAE